MSNREQDIFFEILSAALWGRETNLNLLAGQWEWQNIIAAYDEHALLGVVSPTILSLPKEWLPEVSLQQYMMTKMARLMQMHYEHNDMIATVFDEFEAAGCSPVLLKGQGLATLYPTRCLRSIGDIDVYVDPQKYDIAKQIINKHADTEEVEKAEKHQASHHYSIHTREGVEFEVHHKPSEAANLLYSKRYFKLGTQSLQAENTTHITLPLLNGHVEVRGLSIENNVWYIFNHLVHHFTGPGIGLRQFCDWMLTLRQFTHIATETDIAKLHKTLKDIGMLRAWQILGGILVKQLHLPETDFPFYSEQMARKSQGTVLKEILAGGNFRFYSHSAQEIDLPHGLKRTLKVIRGMYHDSSHPLNVISPWYTDIYMCQCILIGIKCFFLRHFGNHSE